MRAGYFWRRYSYLWWMSVLFSIVLSVLADEGNSAQSLDEKVEELSAEVESLTAEVESQTEELSRIRIGGEVKLRLKNTWSGALRPIGIYGENLEKGQKLNHRMILEVEARISEKLSAGGMVRLSNEGEIIFETGPERFSSDRGSVFVKYNPHNLKSSFGYYDIHFTPLTLMRWDMEDNPEAGGASRCVVCPSEVGAFSSESLEELSPDLTLEGGKINVSVRNYMDTVVLLARPRIAKEAKTYSQYLYGTNIKFLSYHKPSTSFRWFSITVISINDDKMSVTEPEGMPYSPVRNRIYSVDFNLPIREILLLKGEFALSDTDKNLPSEEKISKGIATILGMSVKYPHRILTNASYLRMDPKYKSAYSALSYISNRHGFRISSNYEMVKDKLSIWIFYKWLQELESTIKSEPDLKKTFSTVSFGTSITPIKDFSVHVNYILQSAQRAERATWSKVHNATRSIAIDFIYNLARENSLAFKYQYINHRDKVNTELDYQANVSSVLFSTQF